jgi:hypothetical protein
VIRRKTNRRHMTGDHHGWTADRATLLVRAAGFSARTMSAGVRGRAPPSSHASGPPTLIPPVQSPRTRPRSPGRSRSLVGLQVRHPFGRADDARPVSLTRRSPAAPPVPAVCVIGAVEYAD